MQNKTFWIIANWKWVAPQIFHPSQRRQSHSQWSDLYLPFYLTFKPECCKNSKWIQWMDTGRKRKVMRFSTVEVFMSQLKACPLSTISSRLVPSLSKLTAYVLWMFPPKPMLKWNWQCRSTSKEKTPAWGVHNHGSIYDVILGIV